MCAKRAILRPLLDAVRINLHLTMVKEAGLEENSSRSLRERGGRGFRLCKRSMQEPHW
jgi:hypothetical protein